MLYKGAMAETNPKKAPEMEVRMSFGDHLEELRKRLVRSLVFLLVVIVGLMFFYEDMLRFIVKPHFEAMGMLGYAPHEVPLLPKGYQTPILSAMKMAFIFGLFISSPVVGYQMWAFVAAGLYRSEKKYVVRFAPISFLLFTAGCCFGFFVLIPYALFGLAKMSDVKLFPDAEAAVEEKVEKKVEKAPDGEGDGEGKTSAPKKDEPQGAEPKERAPAPEGGAASGDQAVNPDAKPGDQAAAPNPVREETQKQAQLLKFLFNLQEYLNLVLLLTIILGVIFQLPLIMVFLVKIGLTEPATYNKWRRGAVIFNVCFAALVTPADIFTMVIVAAPMLVLYEIGVVISYLVARKPKPASA